MAVEGSVTVWRFCLKFQHFEQVLAQSHGHVGLVLNTIQSIGRWITSLKRVRDVFRLLHFEPTKLCWVFSEIISGCVFNSGIVLSEFAEGI